MSILDTFTPMGYAKLALAATVVVLIGGALTLQHVDIANLRAALSTEKASSATYREQVAQRDRQAIADRLAEQDRITAERKKADDENDAKLTAARADAVIALAAGDRLRARYAALTAASRRAANDPAPAASGPAASPDDLQADVFGRVVELARLYAAAADDAIAAGEHAEGDYDALTPPAITLGTLKLSNTPEAAP